MYSKHPERNHSVSVAVETKSGLYEWRNQGLETSLDFQMPGGGPDCKEAWGGGGQEKNQQLQESVRLWAVSGGGP